MKTKPLKDMAASVAAMYGDESAIIVTKGRDGFRIGVSEFSDSDLKEALCVAIYHAVSKTLA